MTDRENDLQDNDISNLLDNMDAKEMARLEQWFMAKNGLGNGSGAPTPPSGPGAPPPPPPGPGPEVKNISIWLYLKLCFSVQLPEIQIQNQGARHYYRTFHQHLN